MRYLLLLLISSLATASQYTLPSSGGGGGAVNSVTGSSPIISSGGSDPDISCQVATGSVPGCLAAADWMTFNSKVGSGLFNGSGESTVLTVSSEHIERYAGNGTHSFILPDATTLTNGFSFEFLNDGADASTNLNIIGSDLVQLYSLGYGGRGWLVLNDNSTTTGTWSFSPYVASTASFDRQGLSLTGKLDLTPTASNWLRILAPSGQSSAVFEIKSDGTQVAFVNDSGNSYFNFGTYYGGLGTVSLQSISNGTPIILAETITPNSDNQFDFGTDSNKFRAGYFYSMSAGALGTDTVDVSTSVRLGGSANLSWQGAAHVTRWHVDALAGADQDWYWPGSAPVSDPSVFTIDTSGNITYTTLSSLVPTTPTLSSVLGAGNNAGSQNILDTGHIYPYTDNAWDLGTASLRYQVGYFHYLGDNLGQYVLEANSTTRKLYNASNATMIDFSGSDLVLGSSAGDTVKFVAGDTGGAPSNPGVCAKYIRILDNSGTPGYLCIEQ